MPVVVGAPRSGTTLLRFMLDSHPDLAIPPETGFLAIGQTLEARPGLTAREFADEITGFPPDAPGWQDFGLDAEVFAEAVERLKPFTVADGYRTFYAMYARRHGKPRWGDKSPAHSLHVGAIAAVLPEAHVIHIIRDGRDVAVSLRKRWFSPGEAIEVQAEFWARHVRAARDQAPGPDRYLEVQYEQLLAAPEQELRRICAFLDLPFDTAMLGYFTRTPERLEEHRERRHADGHVLATHEERLRQQEWTTKPPDTSRVGTWKQEMTAEDAATFERLEGDLLRDYGYLPKRRWWRRRPAAAAGS